jgi:hypothetical protein
MSTEGGGTGGWMPQCHDPHGDDGAGTPHHHVEAADEVVQGDRLAGPDVAGRSDPVSFLMLPADEFDLVKALQHAMDALAGDNEGVRLWMLDCGNLVQKHREHAVEASARLGEERARADAAEAKLAELSTAREQARRYLRAVYGPDLVYRAPETFHGPERWIWAIAYDQGPMAETVIGGIEQLCAARREEDDRG